MFDIGWSELLLIGIVALIVVGPKDLPGMFRALGRFTAKARNMAREFTRAMEAAADESGVKDVAKDINSLKRAATAPRDFGLDTIRKTVREATADLEALRDPLRTVAPKPEATPAATAPQPAAPAPEIPAPTEAEARAEALRAEYAARRAAAAPPAAPPGPPPGAPAAGRPPAADPAVAPDPHAPPPRGDAA